MAKKSAFQFRLGDRVNVPEQKNVQGVIGLPRNGLEMEGVAINDDQLYLVRWMGEDGWPQAKWFGRLALGLANLANSPDPAPVAVVGEANKVVSGLAEAIIGLRDRRKQKGWRITRIGVAKKKPKIKAAKRRKAKR